MQTATRTRTRTSGPALDPAYDPVHEIERAHEQNGAVPLDGTPGTAREPGLRRYLRWQVRDFLRYRASALVPLALLAVWIFHHNYHPEVVASAFASGRQRIAGLGTEPAVFRMFALMLGLVAGIGGSILATAGIVSREREGGQQRFLFAKPVRLTSYYLQSLAVSGAGTMAIVVFLQLAIAAAFGRTVPLLDAVIGSAAGFVAVGGLTFLMSTLVRFDVALAGLLSVLTVLLHAAAQDGRWWAVMTAWLLPPLQHLEAFFDGGRNSGLAGQLKAVLELVGYGAAYIAAGVAVLRKRSIIR
jgi:hypothetical protein